MAWRRLPEMKHNLSLKNCPHPSKKYWLFILGTALIIMSFGYHKWHIKLGPTTDNGKWYVVHKYELRKGAHHTNHARIFGKFVRGYNYYILKGIDRVQATAPEGGGYFTGMTDRPTESPIGYELKIFGKSLLDPPRTTSYCSGASYGAFIEGLNRIYHCGIDSLDFDHYETLRMQEINGGRRNDGIKFWGHWNADGFGNHFALVQYSGMGTEIQPNNARPGDFVNISWKKGGGHSVVFLGWRKDRAGKKYIVYWSSQKGTEGYGDQVVSLERIESIKVVRLTHPENLFHFNIEARVSTKIEGDIINF